MHLRLPTGAVVLIAMVASCGGDEEPDALLDVVPTPAAVGETVSFDASRSDHTSSFTKYR